MCDHKLGSLPCDNPDTHEGEGRGCTHTGLTAPDRHEVSSGGEG